MADGFRISEDGSYRVSESLDVRVTEQFISVQSSLGGGLTQIAVASVTQLMSKTLNATGSLLALALKTTPLNWSTQGNGSLYTVANLVFKPSVTLSGTLSILADTTGTEGVVAALNGIGTVSATPSYYKSLLASLSGVGTVNGKGGYLHSLPLVLTATGQINVVGLATKVGTVSLTSVSSVSAVGLNNYNMIRALGGSSLIASFPLFIAKASTSLQGVGSLTTIDKLILNPTCSLLATSSSVIYPIRIVVGASLVGGLGILNAEPLLATEVYATLNSNGTINGEEEMLTNLIVTSGINQRITEEGNTRITETGDFRVIPSEANVISATLTASYSVIPFSGSISAYKNGSYKTVVPYVFFNDAWVNPTIYVKNNGTWKRVH